MLACLKPVSLTLWHGHHLALRSGLCVATAALLTFIFYQHFDLQFGYWGVVSVAAVMQRDFHSSLIKARSRLIGTAFGVMLAVMVMPILSRWPQSLLVLFFLGLFPASLLIFAKTTWSYIGVVTGITFIFIVSVAHTDPGLWLEVSVFRTVDIYLGAALTCICYWIFLWHRTQPSVQPDPVVTAITWRPKAAFLMAAATALSLSPWLLWHYEGGVWAPIACLFIVEENFDKTMKKSWLRLFAHVVAIAIAAILLFLCGSTWGTGLALVAAMFFFGYWIEKPLWGFESGLANTMAIAFCVILLNQQGESGIVYNSMARMFNTMLGVACGMVVVKVIQHYIPRLVANLPHRHNNSASQQPN